VGNVVAVIPTRGRPRQAREALEAIRDTAALVSTEVVIVVDADDPLLPDYRRELAPAPRNHATPATLVVLAGDDTGNLVRATNTVSMRIAREDPAAIIGNLGDDHRTRTPGWDRAITEALATPGIAYGDDLIHGAHLPSAPFISAAIVLALGWYALPCCRHLYIDDAWRELGQAAGCLRYLPDVVVEHMHPAVRKAEWDDGYERVNNQAAVERDRTAFRRWRTSTDFNADVRNVRLARRGAPRDRHVRVKRGGAQAHRAGAR
jgi:hypothetical protein